LKVALLPISGFSSQPLIQFFFNEEARPCRQERSAAQLAKQWISQKMGRGGGDSAQTMKPLGYVYS
jgi:hypothetical protein